MRPFFCADPGNECILYAERDQGMDEIHKKRIEEILSGFQCPKDFVCYTSELTQLCKAEDIGLNSFLLCQEEDPEDCKFSAVVFGDKHFCSCPLRVYIAKKLKK
jgi:hypothetical protein